MLPYWLGLEGTVATGAVAVVAVGGGMLPYWLGLEGTGVAVEAAVEDVVAVSEVEVAAVAPSLVWAALVSAARDSSAAASASGSVSTGLGWDVGLHCVLKSAPPATPLAIALKSRKRLCFSIF